MIKIKEFLKIVKWKKLYILLKKNQINDNFKIQTYLTHRGEYKHFFDNINWPDNIDREKLENKIKRKTVKYWTYYDSEMFKNQLAKELPKIPGHDWQADAFLEENW